MITGTDIDHSLAAFMVVEIAILLFLAATHFLRILIRKPFLAPSGPSLEALQQGTSSEEVEGYDTPAKVVRREVL